MTLNIIFGVSADLKNLLDKLSSNGMLNRIEHKIDKTYMKVSEVAPTLNKISDNLDKVKTEVQNLKDSLSDVELPDEATEALERLTAATKAVDDVIPDDPTPEPEEQA